jgi:hypothetical protein
MTATATMKRPRARATATTADGGAKARRAGAATAAPFDVGNVEQQLYDFVMGRITLSGMRAEAAIALLKQTRSSTSTVPKRRKARKRA